MIEPTEMEQLLIDNGFVDGWALLGDVLTVWLHDEDPPAPLTRPEASDDLAG
jgi:hypothetical protein